MADKSNKSKGASVAKVTFGKRREGKHRKARRPKDGNQKKYIGQGR